MMCAVPRPARHVAHSAIIFVDLQRLKGWTVFCLDAEGDLRRNLVSPTGPRGLMEGT
jgi:hypothetical protein